MRKVTYEYSCECNHFTLGKQMQPIGCYS